MAIYNTETYQVESIMHNFNTKDDVTEWIQSVVYVQILPTADNLLVKSIFLSTDDGLSQEDFDDIDRFTANVIPVVDSTYSAALSNLTNNGSVRTTSNSAISPMSMALKAVEL